LNLFAVFRVADFFDRRHGLRADETDGKNAGADGIAVKVNCAGAALRDAAAEFRARQSDDVADDPQQRHIRRHVDLPISAIDIDLHDEISPFLKPSAESHEESTAAAYGSYAMRPAAIFLKSSEI
jgi:hypothetical protein